MAQHSANYETCPRWPRWWRLVVVGVSTLILCSCQSAGPPPLPDVAAAGPAAPWRAAGVSPLMNPAQRYTEHYAHQGADAPRSPDGAPPDGAPPYATSPSGAPLVAQQLPPVGPFADPSIIRVAAQSPAYPDPAVAPVAAPLPVMPRQGPPQHPFPFPEQVIVPNSPAGLGMPEPGPECVLDGGDRDVPAGVTSQGIVQGLETEDTIAHADTVDGATIVAASNRVKLYAPRFMAVRSVVDLHQGQHVDAVVNHDQKVGPKPISESLRLDTHRQNLAAHGEIADKRIQGTNSQAKPQAELTALLVMGFHNGFLPYEDFALIRRGVLENSDKPRLATGKQAANTWTHDLGVQVVLDGRQANSVQADQKAQAILLFEDKSGPAKLRVIKVASTNAANVGDVVDFTIRYDNMGDQVIGNVTIIDNLTTRLEYVPDSAQASRKANFTTSTNEAGSLILRWEVIDPLPKGEGGLVRFKCRVR